MSSVDRGCRVEVPPVGGALMLPSGRPGIAEPIAHEDGYTVRGLGKAVGSRPRLERVATPAAPHAGLGAAANLAEWRRAQLEFIRLAEEQAALRRVATLVAGQATPDEIFTTVAEEVARLLAADRGTVCRYEGDGTMTVTACWTSEERTQAVGARVALDGDSVAALVWESGRPHRLDSREGLRGPVVEPASSLGAAPSSTVGAPILVEGRVWGVILASSTQGEPFTQESESRLMGFAELVATVISNAVAREELDASRARIVTTADKARRQIQRDLHDGAQQRLVCLILELKWAAANDTASPGELRAELARAVEAATIALDEVRQIASGLHPKVLSRGGLEPALHDLSRRSALPVELEYSAPGRLAEHIEVAAYYVVAESLTNAVKHARASVVRVVIEHLNATLQLSIRDDGVGGADPARGSGLIGLRDRVEAIGGTIAFESPVGAGTSVHVSLALDKPARPAEARRRDPQSINKPRSSPIKSPLRLLNERLQDGV